MSRFFIVPEIMGACIAMPPTYVVNKTTSLKLLVAARETMTRRHDIPVNSGVGAEPLSLVSANLISLFRFNCAEKRLFSSN